MPVRNLGCDGPLKAETRVRIPLEVVSQSWGKTEWRNLPVKLDELIHTSVRRAIETAVHEELQAALGAAAYERTGERRGYRNGTIERTLTGPTGPVPLTLPRATLRTTNGEAEWRSGLVPRYERRLPEVNAAVVATYLAGGNQRRIRAALRPLLKAAPLSKSAVSRIVATLKDDLRAWATRPLSDLDVVYLYLDALVLRVRRDRQVAGVPVLAGVAAFPQDSGHHHRSSSSVHWRRCGDRGPASGKTGRLSGLSLRY